VEQAANKDYGRVYRRGIKERYDMRQALWTRVLEADPDIARERRPAKHKHTESQLVGMQCVAREQWSEYPVGDPRQI
jgi:hypothetical protein